MKCCYAYLNHPPPPPPPPPSPLQSRVPPLCVILSQQIFKLELDPLGYPD